jgi:predicted metal-dependent phosphoesterase TrpH
MLIDLHCHTKAVRRGEPATRNVTKEVFKQKVIEANTKVISITNHDLFDRAQFEEFQKEMHVPYGRVSSLTLNMMARSTTWSL